MNLELTDDEAVLLRRVLDGAYRDLRQEVAHTDSPAFRRDLRADEELVLAMLDRIGGILPNPV
jgi:hypothetical protein